MPSLRYADDTNLIAESEEELKSLWMKVKEKSELGREGKKIITWDLDPWEGTQRKRETAQVDTCPRE